MSSDTIRLTRREHVNLVLSAFRKRYPGVTVFRSIESFAGGSSLTVTYIDGPPLPEATAFVDAFRTRGFDGMTDCAYGMTFEYEGQCYSGGTSFLHVKREYSRNYAGERALQMMATNHLTSVADRLVDGRSVLFAAQQDIDHADLRSQPQRLRPKAAISFAELKRRLTVGTVVRTTFFNATGGILKVRDACPIVNVQSNAIVIAHEPGATKGSWLHWPPARLVEIHSAHEFSVRRSDGSPIARYQILQTSLAA